MAIAGMRIEALAQRRTPDVHIPAPVPEAAPVIGLVVGLSCDRCRYRDVCAVLVKAHLPVLCERMERGEAKKMREALR